MCVCFSAGHYRVPKPEGYLNRSFPRVKTRGGEEGEGERGGEKRGEKLGRGKRGPKKHSKNSDFGTTFQALAVRAPSETWFWGSGPLGPGNQLERREPRKM